MAEEENTPIDLELDEDIKSDLQAVEEEGQLPEVAVSLIRRLLSNQEKMAGRLKPLLKVEYDRNRDKEFYTKWGRRAGYFMSAVFTAVVGAFFSYLFGLWGGHKH